MDEAHHAIAETYLRILEYFQVLEPDTRKLLVGFTATPKRGDGIGLDEVFLEIVYSRNLPEMIAEGYSLDYHYVNSIVTCEKVLQAALKSRKPCLLDVQIDPTNYPTAVK